MHTSPSFAGLPQTLGVVDGWPINLANSEDTVSAIIGSAKCRDSFAVFTMNLDHLVKLRRSSVYRDAYAKARYVTADGEPVALLASRQGARIERTTGSDLILPLAEAAAAQGIGVYLYGTTPEVLAGVSRTIGQRSGCNHLIVGAASPAQGFDPQGSEADAALDLIAASGAELCFVALGAPKQELLAARGVARNIHCGFVCIGAGLDFLAGTQRRAPAFMRHYKLEWLWRLLTNPGRFAARYTHCALLLAQIVLFAPIKPRLTRAST